MADVDNNTNANGRLNTEASEPSSTSYLLKNMILKKIVKESHPQSIEQLFFNKTTKNNHNLIASIGGTQATIYDNENRGNNMDVILNFVNVDTPALLELQTRISESNGTSNAQAEKKKKKDQAKTTAKQKPVLLEGEKIDYDNSERILYCGEWLQAPDNKHDTWLAVGGVDRLIHLISIGRTRTFHIMHGHEDTIELMASTDVVLPSCAANERNAAQYARQLLASYSRDGTVRVWDLSAFAPDSEWHEGPAAKRARGEAADAPPNPCLAVLHAPNTTAMTFVPATHGTQLLTATKQGTVHVWDLSRVVSADSTAENKKRKAEHLSRDWSVPVAVTESRALKSPHKTEVDCVRCLDDKRVVSRSADSKLVVWDWTSEQIERELRVKGKSEGTRALFDVSSDGQYLAVGSKKGAVYLYELHTGECIHVLEHKRARQSVRACAFSAHCRHVLFATEALIWRWDHLDPKTLKDEDRARLALRGEPEPSAEAIISEDSADSKPEKLE